MGKLDVNVRKSEHPERQDEVGGGAGRWSRAGDALGNRSWPPIPEDRARGANAGRDNG